MSLTFNPLCWTYHDQWAWRTWKYNSVSGWVASIYPHQGHCHFFMLGHDKDSADGQTAHSGTQDYDFEVDQTWGPGSSDTNQALNVRIIGTPRWYVSIREFWRRVYIQDWSGKENPNTPAIIGKTGVKYDASKSFHSFGPFREGRDVYFHWNKMSRTLPVEYFKDEQKAVRDHYLRVDPSGYHIWNTTAAGFEPSDMLIPRTQYAGCADNYVGVGDGPAEDNAARVYAYQDPMYAWPTIEYQVVDHLEWERPPGWENRDVSADSFGDGFSLRVSLPFSIDGVVQSPFADDACNVSPPGTYFHGFGTRHPERVLKYPDENEPGCPEEYLIPPELLGQPVQWTVPDHMAPHMDGVWVQQCLGGIVRAKAKITIEDNFGGRRDVWTSGTEFLVTDPFEGVDQGQPMEE